MFRDAIEIDYRLTFLYALDMPTIKKPERVEHIGRERLIILCDENEPFTTWEANHFDSCAECRSVFHEVMHLSGDARGKRAS
jgi:hypothetical protein